MAKKPFHWTQRLYIKPTDDNPYPYRPCRPAIRWAKKYHSFSRAWEMCTNPDWLLWLVERTRISKRKFYTLSHQIDTEMRKLWKGQRPILFSCGCAECLEIARPGSSKILCDFIRSKVPRPNLQRDLNL